MYNNNKNLKIDIKAQEKFREWVAKRNSLTPFTLGAISFGDSDIDYSLSPDKYINNIRILNAPYSQNKIKHPIAYSGLVGKLLGQVRSYVRVINPNGRLSSMYSYPNPPSTFPNTVSDGFTVGNSIPTLENAYNWSTWEFNDFGAKGGIIVFNETIPDNYIDASTNLPLRILEQYEFSLSSSLPSNWELIFDNNFGSFLLAHNSTAIQQNAFRTITITGKKTGITKIFTFNV